MRRIVKRVSGLAALVAVLAMPRLSVASDWRSRQEIWWDDATLVKEAVIAGEALAASCPAVANDPHAGDSLWKVSSLLLVFDSMRGRKQVRQLVSLVSYYLGEAPGEMFSCVVVRKGALARNALLELRKVGTNECESKLGHAPPAGTDRKRCLTTPEMQARIDELLRRIRENSPCDLEK